LQLSRSASDSSFGIHASTFAKPEMFLPSWLTVAFAT
jgi:hypothetical protein